MHLSIGQRLPDAQVHHSEAKFRLHMHVACDQADFFSTKPRQFPKITLSLLKNFSR